MHSCQTENSVKFRATKANNEEIQQIQLKKSLLCNYYIKVELLNHLKTQ